MTTDTTDPAVSTDGPIEEQAKRDKIKAETYKKMLDVLDELLNHDHTYIDNYGSACQCQCQCVCQCRGIL